MEWPWQYNFPPFFTLQQNEDTKRKQLDAWSDLILNYCKFKRLFKLDVGEMSNSELFNNKKIDRKCSNELINEIFDYLIKTNRAEWIEQVSKSKNSPQLAVTSRKCFIYWHTLEEWAKLIYDYVSRNSMQNTVCTFYELTESDECKKEEFFNIDKDLFKKALRVLSQQRKAETIFIDENTDEGVKFF